MSDMATSAIKWGQLVERGKKEGIEVSGRKENVKSGYDTSKSIELSETA